jgi:hypothetical protein
MSRTRASGALTQMEEERITASQPASLANRAAIANNPVEAESRVETRGKVRLSLDVSPQLNNLLERLSDELGVTKSEVLRKAVVLMKVAVDAHNQGKKLGIAERDQPLTSEIVGLF